jgi:hypothetical protein
MGNVVGGGWRSFGNLGGHAVPASVHPMGNVMSGGWRSFGNMSHGSGVQIPGGFRSNARSDGQWRSFGNSRTGNFAATASNVSGWSAFGRNPGRAFYAHQPHWDFGSNRFSTNQLERSRFSSFSSFDSGRSSFNFGRSRFGESGFGGFDFGNSGFGHSGFSSSFFGSGLSLIPNLLFGGLFGAGPSLFGGPGMLAANVISLAASSIISLASNGSDQGGFTGDYTGIAPGGFGSGFGFAAAPVVPACGVGVSFGAPGWAWREYCGPYLTYPLGWSGRGYLSGRGIGYNAAGFAPGGSDLN